MLRMAAGVHILGVSLRFLNERHSEPEFSEIGSAPLELRLGIV